MKTIKSFFAESEEHAKAKSGEVQDMIEYLEPLRYTVDLTHDEKSLVFYYAVFIAKSILQSKNFTCTNCKEMISSSTSEFSIDIPEKEYCAIISRGGLCRPSDLVLVTALHVWHTWCYIRDNRHIKEFFMELSNQRVVFAESFEQKIAELETTKNIINSKCSVNHPYKPLFKRVVRSVFNAISKNLMKEINSVIHSERKRKATLKSTAKDEKVTSDERKIRKLTSGGLLEAEKKADCGVCRFCKDKPKFGGKNTLRRKCIEKSQ